MQKTTFLLLAFLLTQAVALPGQAPVRRLYTQAMQQFLAEKDPIQAEAASAAERFAKESQQIEPPVEALIPVVFHFLVG